MHQRQHGGVGVAFIIPNLNIMSNEKIRNKLSVIIGEMVAILLALGGGGKKETKQSKFRFKQCINQSQKHAIRNKTRYSGGNRANCV